jgi:hypothetical protein
LLGVSAERGGKSGCLHPKKDKAKMEYSRAQKGGKERMHVQKGIIQKAQDL